MSRIWAAWYFQSCQVYNNVVLTVELPPLLRRPITTTTCHNWLMVHQQQQLIHCCFNNHHICQLIFYPRYLFKSWKVTIKQQIFKNKYKLKAFSLNLYIYINILFLQGNGQQLWDVDEQRLKLDNRFNLSNNLTSFH